VLPHHVRCNEIDVFELIASEVGAGPPCNLLVELGTPQPRLFGNRPPPKTQSVFSIQDIGVEILNYEGKLVIGKHGVATALVATALNEQSLRRDIQLPRAEFGGSQFGGSQAACQLGPPE